MKRREALKWTAWATGISSLPISLASLQSCKPSGDPGWTPAFLSIKEAQILNNIAEIILPTDNMSPGAQKVHCPEFVDLLVKDCLSPDEQKTFKEGLKLIADEYQNSTNQNITYNVNDTMRRHIEELDKNAFDGHGNLMHQTYRQLKQMVLLAYFTSQTVMLNQLDYHAIPGEYRGCIAMPDKAKVYVDDNVVG